MSESGTYRRVLADRSVLGQLLCVFVGTVPLGMMPLAIVLAVHAWTGSFTASGYASAAFTCGTACGLLVQGWAIDRFGARAGISAAVTICVLSIVGAILLGPGGHLHVGFVGCVFLAGVAMPEITTAVRVWLAGSSLPGPIREASYALLGALFQAGIVLGPLLATITFQNGGPRFALSVTGALVCVASATYIAVFRPVNITAPDQQPGQISRRSGGVGILLLVAAVTGAPIGVLGIVAPRIATAGGTPFLAGLLLAALAAGEVVGALGYGAVHWRISGYARLVLGLSLSCAGLLVAAVASSVPGLVVGCFFVAGMGAGPIAVLLATATEAAAGPSAVGRLSGLRVAVGLGATSAGSALAGIGAATLSSSATLALTAALFIIAALLGRGRRQVWDVARF